MFFCLFVCLFVSCVGLVARNRASLRWIFGRRRLANGGVLDFVFLFFFFLCSKNFSVESWKRFRLDVLDAVRLSMQSISVEVLIVFFIYPGRKCAPIEWNGPMKTKTKKQKKKRKRSGGASAVAKNRLKKKNEPRVGLIFCEIRWRVSLRIVQKRTKLVRKLWLFFVLFFFTRFHLFVCFFLLLLFDDEVISGRAERRWRHRWSGNRVTEFTEFFFFDRISFTSPFAMALNVEKMSFL